MSKLERDYEIVVLTGVLDLLDTLSRALEPLGATELARQSDTTRSATFRILVSLERRGTMRKAPGTARYLPGPGLATHGRRMRGDSDLVLEAHPHLEALNGAGWRGGCGRHVGKPSPRPRLPPKVGESLGPRRRATVADTPVVSHPSKLLRRRVARILDKAAQVTEDC